MAGRSKAVKKVKNSTARQNTAQLRWPQDHPKIKTGFVLNSRYQFLWISPSYQAAVKKEIGTRLDHGLNILDLIPNKSQKLKTKKIFDRVLKGEALAKFNHSIWPIRQLNGYRYSPVSQSNGKIIGLSVEIIKPPASKSGSFRNGTVQVDHEKSLLSWKNRFELVVAAFGRVVYDYDVQTGKIIWSGNIEEVLGYSPTEMDDIKAWGELIHPEDQSTALSLLEEAKKNVSKYDVRYRFKSKKNDYIWVKDNGFFLANNQGVACSMLGEMEDITQQIQTEKDIRHLASFPLHNPEIVIEIKKDLTLNYANPSFFESIRRLHLSDHKPFVAEEIMERLELTAPWKITADVHIAGRTFNEKIYYLAEKELVRIYAYDLTDRLAVEKRFSELELTYKTLFESATDCILIISLDEEPGKIISANPAASVMHGYTLSEFLQLNLKDIDVSLPGALSFDDRIQNLEQSGRQNFEVSHYRKDGSVIPLEVVATIIEVSGKRYLLSIERDISSRKKAEDEIRLQFRFIESLVAATPDVVYVYDIDEDKYVYANQHMADSYGLPLDQLKSGGHDLMQHFLAPEDVAQIPEWIESLKKAKDGEIVESQFKLRTREGTWRTFRSSESVFLRDSHGRVKQFIGAASDVTERVAAEEALRESEARFRTLHEAVFAGIAIHDKGIIVECNKGLSDLTGFSYDELIGLNAMNFVHPDDRHIAMDKINSGDENPYDIRGIRRDGSVYELEIHGKAIPYKGLMLRITELRDVTERKKAAEKILEQNARLQTIAEDLKFKNDQLDEFTQIVSHNLRSPAGNIVSLARFLESDQNAADRAEILTLLRNSGDIILNTLSELNEVLKIKQNKNIDKQELQFESMLDNVKNMLNAHIADVGAIIESDFSRAPIILYPNIYLESIFLNLLSNALKYKHPDRQAHIKFVTKQSNEQIILEVTDNGLGIDLERYGHQIFKMRKTFHHHPDSRGIGLFMIKNQIEAMGGQIGVMSVADTGSTFSVIF